MVAKVSLIVQLAIGIVFLLSALAKAQDPRGFARGVVEYRILPSSLAYGVGLVLLPLEGFLFLSHLTGWLLGLAVPLGLLLLLAFALAVGVNLGRGRVLPCYCFGSRAQGGEMLSGRTLARLLLLLSGEAFLLVEVVMHNHSRAAIYSLHVGSLYQFSLAFFWASFVLLAGSWLLGLMDLVNLFTVCTACSRSKAVANSRSP
jgi:Methylamine utilisation protein MauE